MPSTNSSGSVDVTGTGRFITFEGIDGAGKSSHLAWIPAYLGGLGFDVVETREPGGTPLGEQLRALVLAHPMRPETETLMMFAARAQHLADVIEPAIARGALVICDRFTDATFAYQGGGRGLGADRLAILEQWVQQGRQPDRTYLFDLPVGTAETRRLHVRQPDRFEQEKAEFFERVRAAYLARAAADAGRFRRVDASLAFNDIRTWLEHDLRQMVLA